MEENYFFDLEQMSFKEKRPGVQLKSITGEENTIADCSIGTQF